MNKELKEICSKCEDYIHCQGKGCAFRSLGNEYCNEVENVNKLINDLQQENKKYKEVIDKAIEFIYAHSSMKPPYYEFREFYNVSNLSELLDILKEVE